MECDPQTGELAVCLSEPRAYESWTRECPVNALAVIRPGWLSTPFNTPRESGWNEAVEREKAMQRGGRVERIAWGWMRLTYGATAVLGVFVGGVMLFGPERLARKVVGVPFMLPEQDPIIYGALAGIWFTVGLLCVLGARSPLKFLPLLVLQFVYKGCWFAGVFVPLWSRGEFPEWGWASAAGNAIWMALDIKSIPWWYVVSPHLDPQLAASELLEPTLATVERSRAA